MKHNSISPCLTCTRVQDPDSCENKRCGPWQQWFLRRWAHLQDQYRKAGIYPPETPNDPCKGCDISAAACTDPCRRKRAWQASREVRS